MNRNRRDRIQAVRDSIEEHHLALSAGIHEDLMDLQSEEQEAFDNLSEGLQQSDQGQRTEQAADALSDAASDFEDVMTQIQDILDKLDEAVDL